MGMRGYCRMTWQARVHGKRPKRRPPQTWEDFEGKSEGTE